MTQAGDINQLISNSNLTSCPPVCPAYISHCKATFNLTLLFIENSSGNTTKAEGICHKVRYAVF